MLASGCDNYREKEREREIEGVKRNSIIKG